MRIDGIRSTALHKRPGRPGREWRASSAAEVVQDAVVLTRRPAIEGDFQSSSTAPSIIRHAAALQAPSPRVLQALESYARIAALVAEPGEYLDVYV